MSSIESLFPITFTITQEIIDISIPTSPYMCQGAISLTKALGEWGNGRKITWGQRFGMVDNVFVTTKEDITMPLVQTPTRVTFIVSHEGPRTNK